MLQFKDPHGTEFKCTVLPLEHQKDARCQAHTRAVLVLDPALGHGCPSYRAPAE